MNLLNIPLIDTRQHASVTNLKKPFKTPSFGGNRPPETSSSSASAAPSDLNSTHYLDKKPTKLVVIDLSDDELDPDEQELFGLFLGKPTGSSQASSGDRKSL